MHPHRLGSFGEHLARVWLRLGGFTIVNTNLRRLGAEVDVVAFRGRTLHLVEVKTRTRFSHGGPWAAVHRRKRQQQVKVARELLGQPVFRNVTVSFDVLEVWLRPHLVLRHHADAWRVDGGDAW